MESISNKYKIIILLSSATVFLYSIGVIIYAWLLESGIASPSVTGHLPIAKDAAFSFILIISSLTFCIKYKTNSIKLISKFISIATILIAMASIFQNLSGEQYKRLLPFVSSNITFGMSLQTAFCFICLGVALVFIDSRKHRRLVQALLHLTSSIAFIVIMGHLLQIPELYKFTFFSAMAVYSAICFLLVSMSASLVHPTVGLTGLLLGKSSGSVMARRLTIRICGVMLLATYLLILCHRHRWFGLDYALAVFSITFIMLTLFFIYKTSVVLNKIEKKKDIALANFTAVVESAPNAFIMADMKGKISLVNKMACTLFGYESSKLIGQSLDVIVPDRFRNAHREKQPNYFRNPKPRNFDHLDDLYALRKDGSEFPVELGLTPITTEEGTVALASIVDITIRKQNESIIRKQLSELEIRNHEMEQFTYIASHDLQEPLRTVLNYIQLLEEDYPEQVKGEIAGHLKEMEAAVNRMGTLVRHLLDYGKLGQNKELVRTDTCKVMKDVLADLSTLIKNENATIGVSKEMPVLDVYATELRQLFQNLINNAIKFRKKDIPPIIKIECDRKEGYYEFAISDNGIGINPKHFQRIFLMFQRLNRHQDFSGYGVGLANCKKIVELHGGTICVESEIDKGSTFKFTISTTGSNGQST